MRMPLSVHCSMQQKASTALQEVLVMAHVCPSIAVNLAAWVEGHDCCYCI
jgi:hypothetical protein